MQPNFHVPLSHIFATASPAPVSRVLSEPAPQALVFTLLVLYFMLSLYDVCTWNRREIYASYAQSEPRMHSGHGSGQSFPSILQFFLRHIETYINPVHAIPRQDILDSVFLFFHPLLFAFLCVAQLEKRARTNKSACISLERGEQCTILLHKTIQRHAISSIFLDSEREPLNRSLMIYTSI